MKIIRKKTILKEAVVLLIGVSLLLISVNTSAVSLPEFKSKSLNQAPVIWVDWDYGDGDPSNDDNNDLIDGTHKKTIQAGVNAVDVGGTVKVWDVTSVPGEYQENVVIDRSLTLTPLSNYPPFVFIDGQNADHVITINADDVTIIKGDKARFWIKNGFDGIHSEGHNKIKIIGNVIDDNNREGIKFENCGAAGLDVEILENDIDNNDENGIYLHQCNHVKIEENPSISNNDENGILVSESTQITIKNNPKIFHNGFGAGNLLLYERSGIILSESDNNEIEDNICDDNDGWGIGIINGSDNNLVKRNQCKDNGDDGINIGFYLTGPDDNKLKTNDVHHSDDEGIHVYSGDDNIIDEDNKVHHNTLAGIIIDTNTGVGTKIENNQVFHNGGGTDFQCGILICPSHRVEVLNNNVHNNVREGIYIYSDSGDPANNHLIHGNTVTDNQWDGICIKVHRSDDNVIRKNQVSNNGNGDPANSCGIRIMAGSLDNKIYNNNIVDNANQAFDNSVNDWDNGWPIGGNYWNDFDAPGEGAFDTHSGPAQAGPGVDGIVDLGGAGGGLNPYAIPGGGNTDDYPLILPDACGNRPPTMPGIDGPPNGRPRTNYEYAFVSTDNEEYPLYYYIEWGDGEFEDWFGPFPSGEEITMNHSWDEQGTFIIRAKSRDTRDAESDWAEFEVTIPRSKSINTLFLNFFENHPNLLHIIEKLIHRLGLQ